jgi:hypothetical protein
MGSLRPMHWQNQVDFLVAVRNQVVVTVDGQRNARRLI